MSLGRDGNARVTFATFRQQGKHRTAEGLSKVKENFTPGVQRKSERCNVKKIQGL